MLWKKKGKSVNEALIERSKKMDNVRKLRDELAKVFTGLRDGNVDYKAAKEMNNAAGKMISTVKIQLEYSHLRGEKPQIGFMKCK